MGEYGFIAGYELERVLGRGGMGMVYLAKHPRLPRSVALKLLDETMYGDEQARARFQREAELAARLDHPNIVAVYDRGVENRRPWIAMQYVDGTDAGAIGSFDAARAVRVISEVAQALDYAHARGVLHRDIKPGNILLGRAEYGSAERVMLADFGIAKLHLDHNPLTQTGSFTATLAFAAPEQLSAMPLDAKCDQYSLACTFFAMVTGASPFEASNPVAVIQSHMSAPPPSAVRVRPDLPAGVDAVLATAMAKEPGARFGSCGEFAAALRQVFDQADDDDSAGQPLSGSRVAPTILAPRPVPTREPERAAVNAVSEPVETKPERQKPERRLVPGRVETPQVWWRRRVLAIPAVSVAMVIVVAGGVVLANRDTSTPSPYSATVAAAEAANAQRYKEMSDVFPDLVGTIGGTSKNGFGGANCVRSGGFSEGDIEVTCTSAEGPTFVVKDFGSAANVRNQIDKRFSNPSGTTRRPHSDCRADPAVLLIVPRVSPTEPRPDVFTTPVLTTFPDDPVRSRYRIDVEVKVALGATTEKWTFDAVMTRWWSSAPLCG
ncbi:protein kinase domain-containing protein [Nocardia asteroides]